MFGIGALIGLILVLGFRFVFDVTAGFLTSLGMILGFGLISSAMSLLWIIFSTNSSIAEQRLPVPVSLRDFLSNSEAMIAPNLHPDTCDNLTKWLIDFSASHGEDSVWVLPHSDAPSTDTVILAVKEISSNEVEILKKFDADSIRDLSEAAKNSLFPHIDDRKKRIEVFWD